jgi:hypothetical protein
MQRPLKFIPSETWYYYTFYNSYDDEQREYRFERHTKQVERMQSKPRCLERYICSKHESSLNYRNPVKNNDLAVANMKSTEALIVRDTLSVEKKKDHIHDASPILCLLGDQKISPFQRVGESAAQLVEHTKVIIFQTNGNNYNFLRVTLYLWSSLQYEKLMKIITLPKVATGILLCDLILLVLILY